MDDRIKNDKNKTIVRIIRIICFIGLFIVFCLQAYSLIKKYRGPEECFSCYNSKEYRKAYEICSASANNGNMSSKLILGKMYDDGLYVKQDFNSAEKLYTEVANVKDNSEAQRHSEFYLGELYKRKDFTKQNIEVSAKWYKSSADHGFNRAQLKYAILLFAGYGTDKNNNLAKEYLKKASQNGLQKDADPLLLLINSPDSDEAAKVLIEQLKASNN